MCLQAVHRHCLKLKQPWKLQASSSSDRPPIGPGSVSRELQLGGDEGNKTNHWRATPWHHVTSLTTANESGRPGARKRQLCALKPRQAAITGWAKVNGYRVKRYLLM
jgi:hypothetical protein